MNSFLLIAIGSAAGGVARHWCSVAIAARTATELPVGTIAINAIGSFLIGLIAVLLEGDARATAHAARDLLIVGVLGGYTTFSAFSLQTLNLLRGGRFGYAAANVALSLLLCLTAVVLGYLLAKLMRSWTA